MNGFVSLASLTTVSQSSGTNARAVFFPLFYLGEIPVVLKECVASHEKLVINHLVDSFMLEVCQELH